jgi:hypothetical protein
MRDIGDKLLPQIRLFFKVIDLKIGVMKVALQGQLKKFELFQFNIMVLIVCFAQT